jgi:hypothetical protein
MTHDKGIIEIFLQKRAFLTLFDNLESLRVRLGLRFQKVRFKITILKCSI